VEPLDNSARQGFWQGLLHEEARLIPRIQGAFRLDPAVYAEIDEDPASIPQSFVVVIGSALVAGLSGSLGLLFLSVAGLLFAWLIAAALIWAVAILISGRDVDYSRTVRCLGFAYVWVTPLVLSGLPWYLGQLVTLGAMALLFYSFLLATQRVIGEHALRVCAIALVLPFVLMWVATRAG